MTTDTDEGATATAAVLPPPQNVDRWFIENILIHEGALMRYLRREIRGFTGAGDALDVRQDVYIRVYEYAKVAQPELPKAFLFSTARNYLADAARRRRIVSIVYGLDTLAEYHHLEPTLSSERHISGAEELQRLSDALNYELSDDCRDVVWLRRVEGLSQKQTADKLDMKEGTVESHLCRGLRILADAISKPEREI